MSEFELQTCNLGELEIHRLLLHAVNESPEWVEGVIAGLNGVKIGVREEGKTLFESKDSTVRGIAWGWKLLNSRYRIPSKNAPEWIKKRRKIIGLMAKLGLTIEDLTDMCDLKYHTVSNIVKKGCSRDIRHADMLIESMLDYSREVLGRDPWQPYEYDAKLRYFLELFDVTPGELSIWSEIPVKRILRFLTGDLDPTEVEEGIIDEIFGNVEKDFSMINNIEKLE